MSYCTRCGRLIEEWDAGYYARNQFCIPCYNTYRDSLRKIRCSFCGVELLPEHASKLNAQTACKNCYAEQKREIEKNTCLSCKKHLRQWEKKYRVLDEGVLCEKCHSGYPSKTKIPLLSAPQTGGRFSRLLQALLLPSFSE